VQDEARTKETIDMTTTTVALYEVVERMQQAGHGERAINKAIAEATGTRRSARPTRLRSVLARVFGA
jgi:hypothetical protein